jgi:hypothetical protein
VEKIGEIMRATYERKTRGPWLGTDGRTPVQITVSVEPTTPCVTNTHEGTLAFRQPIFSKRGAVGQGSNRENEVEVQVHEVTINYLHHAEVVVQQVSKWLD